MITGWFISKAFGLDSKEKDGIEAVVKIQNPTLSSPGQSSFPSPLLVMSQEDVINNFQLPAVLMSLGLAMVNYGQTGDESHLHAYRLLKYLGREVTVSLQNDVWDNGGEGDLLPGGGEQVGRSTLVREWVLSGNIAGLSGYVTPEHLVQSDENSSASRAKALITYLEDTETDLDEYWKTKQLTPWQDLPNLWEIKTEISEALGNIKTYVESISETRASRINV
jgi:hypothetical protein